MLLEAKHVDSMASASTCHRPPPHRGATAVWRLRSFRRTLFSHRSNGARMSWLPPEAHFPTGSCTPPSRPHTPNPNPRMGFFASVSLKLKPSVRMSRVEHAVSVCMRICTHAESCMRMLQPSRSVALLAHVTERAWDGMGTEVTARARLHCSQL